MPNFKDITGQRFGRLLVVEFHSKTQWKHHHLSQWLCRCDCGNNVVVAGANLRRGNTKSCGCLRKAAFRDIVGQRFGRLVALSPYTRRNRAWRWLCIWPNYNLLAP